MAESRETELVGICGLYCGTCPSCLAPRIGDHDELRRRSSRMGVSEEEVTCDGCLSAHVAKPCVDCRHGFRTCAAEHGVTWCFECTDFPCERLLRFRDAHVVGGISHHERVIDDLASMRANGVSAWLEAERVRARCASCGGLNYWYAHRCRSCGGVLR